MTGRFEARETDVMEPEANNFSSSAVTLKSTLSGEFWLNQWIYCKGEKINCITCTGA